MVTKYITRKAVKNRNLHAINSKWFVLPACSLLIPPFLLYFLRTHLVMWVSLTDATTYALFSSCCSNTQQRKITMEFFLMCFDHITKQLMKEITVRWPDTFFLIVLHTLLDVQILYASFSIQNIYLIKLFSLFLCLLGQRYFLSKCLVFYKFQICYTRNAVTS